jgi:hypothetical protein
MRYYYIYKVTHVNGKYYIGRHSTKNLNDGYLGSGKWPKSIKDKSTLKKEILEFVDNKELLKEREAVYLEEHFGKPGCMNATKDPVGFNSENHPMLNPEVAKKISGDNHWTRKNPEKILRGKNHWMGKDPDAREKFIQNTPSLDGRNSKLATARGKNIFQTNNPSTWRSEQGIHHWQNGNAPNADGKLNQKLIQEGRHNFQGPAHNQKMIAEGRHNFLGSSSNEKMLAQGKHPSQKKLTCEHCGKTVSSGMHKRWHGDRCRKQ